MTKPISLQGPVATVLMAVAALPTMAGDNVCAPRSQIVAQLAGEYRETSVAHGIAENGGVIEVMRSRERGTFTIIITMPDGFACMIAAGRNWEELPVLAQGVRH